MMKHMAKALIRTDETLWAAVPLRLALGIVFLAHGAQKLFGWFGGRGLQGTAQHFAQAFGMRPGILWAGIDTFGEFAGGALVLSGLVTRFGALNIAAAMLVAIARVHRRAFFIPAGMEFSLALLGIALALLISGGGKLSADAAIQKMWNRQAGPAPEAA